MSFDFDKEILEAISAGERALVSLREAYQHMESAGNWGIIDILGGGLITDLIKHSKMNDAQRCMERARYDLSLFKKELDDVDDYIPDVYVGDLLTIGDFLFDGFIMDLLVQSRISETKRQISDTMYQVEEIIYKLRANMNNY